MLSKTKKVILTLFLSLFLITNLSVPFAQAQTWYDQGFFGTDGWYARVHDPNQPTEIFGERYTHAQVQWVLYGLIANVLNFFMAPELAYCIVVADGNGAVRVANIAICLGVGGGSSINAPTPIADSSKRSGSESFINTITSNPVSSVVYFKDLKARLKLVPEAQAQGFGFTAANPVLELWRLVRNITYFLLVIVVIIMAFMIMFRTKISPQVVITVQSALPKIVVALILITFSYAIAGFMIDLMYVVVGLLAGIVLGSGFTAGVTWGSIFSQLTNGWGALELMSIYGTYFFPALTNTLLEGGIGFAIVGLTAIIPIILTIIVAIMLLVLSLKIIWMLVKTYVTVLFQIILGPIQILLGVFGGGSFGGWLKPLIANLAVYPITGFLFVLAFIFLRSATDTQWFGIITLFYEAQIGMPLPDFPFGLDGGALATGRGWSPPMTIGTRAIELMWLAASLVTLTMIPKAIDISKKFIMGGRFEMSSAIGEGFAPMAAGYAWGRGQANAAIQGQLGYGALHAGTTLQGIEGKGLGRSMARGLGRTLTQYGERNAMAIRNRSGALTGIGRKGTIREKDFKETGEAQDIS